MQPTTSRTMCVYTNSSLIERLDLSCIIMLPQSESGSEYYLRVELKLYSVQYA